MSDLSETIRQRVLSLFNPRRQKWSDHFAWSDDGAKIIGLTACGRATIVALNLNNVLAVTVRKNWIQAGWYPPDFEVKATKS